MIRWKFKFKIDIPLNVEIMKINFLKKTVKYFGYLLVVGFSPWYTFVTRMNRGRYDDAVVVLPCELQVEIPPWLPEKTLLRLRCVCKFWKTLVFDPIFVKLHVEGSRRDTTPRYCSMQRLLDDHPSLMDEVGGHGFDQKCHNMVGVRNGLVCVWAMTTTRDCDCDRDFGIPLQG